MSVKTFWITLLKILGLCILLQSLPTIQQLISWFFVKSINGAGTYFFAMIVSLAVYFLILYFFLFKTNWLIEKLQLEKGFKENKIELDIKSFTLLNIAIIVIGAIIFINSLPALAQQIALFFQQRNLLIESPVSQWIVFYFVKLILGYLMMIKSKQIAGFFHKEPELDQSH